MKPEIKKNPWLVLLVPYSFWLYYSALFAFVLGIWFINLIGLLFIFKKENKTTATIFQFLLKLLTLIYIDGVRVMGGLRLSFPRKEVIRNSPPSILIANHPSSIDAPIIIGKTSRITCVFKAALKKNLLLANTARLAGYVSNDLGFETIKKASSSLKHGSHILIFPEGTRTVGPVLDDLNPSFLLIARRAQVPVRLISIHTNSNLLIKGRHFLQLPDLPTHFHIRVGPSFTFSEAEPINRISKYLRAYYLYHLEQELPLESFERLWPRSLSFHFEIAAISARIASSDLPQTVDNNALKPLFESWLVAFGIFSSELLSQQFNQEIAIQKPQNGCLHFTFSLSNPTAPTIVISHSGNLTLFQGELFKAESV